MSDERHMDPTTITTTATTRINHCWYKLPVEPLGIWLFYFCRNDPRAMAVPYSATTQQRRKSSSHVQYIYSVIIRVIQQPHNPCLFGDIITIHPTPAHRQLASPASGTDGIMIIRSIVPITTALGILVVRAHGTRRIQGRIALSSRLTRR